ncbi:MAG: peptidoglycan-binding protein, partial [Pedobacter sp.]
MATARILLGFLCFASISSLGQSDGDLLKEATARTQLLNTARREIGVRELTGKNDGKKVVEYLASVKLSIGEPWCAAFISWVFKQNGYLEPNTGWSPAMFPKSRILANVIENASKANVFGIYIIAKKRIAHVGLVEDQH